MKTWKISRAPDRKTMGICLEFCLKRMVRRTLHLIKRAIPKKPRLWGGGLKAEFELVLLWRIGFDGNIGLNINRLTHMSHVTVV